jgi:zinc protease
MAAPSAQPGTSATSFSVPVVVYRKLPNGLGVVVSENHAAPVVVVEVMYRIGFRIEPRSRTGFAHLFEHLTASFQSRRPLRAVWRTC